MYGLDMIWREGLLMFAFFVLCKNGGDDSWRNRWKLDLVLCRRKAFRFQPQLECAIPHSPILMGCGEVPAQCNPNQSTNFYKKSTAQQTGQRTGPPQV